MISAMPLPISLVTLISLVLETYPFADAFSMKVRPGTLRKEKKPLVFVVFNRFPRKTRAVLIAEPSEASITRPSTV